MKRLFNYVFFCLWTDISWADYNKAKEFVGPIRSEYHRIKQEMDQHEKYRKARFAKLDQKIADLHVRIADYRKRAGLTSRD